MSGILSSVIGSIVGGFTSRLMYSAIDHIDSERFGNGKKTLWWGIMIFMIITTIVLIIYCMKIEKCQKNRDTFSESFVSSTM